MKLRKFIPDFQQFIKVNDLKKKDIAAFLGVSNAFITQIVQGSRALPLDKFRLIRSNASWDSSMFDEECVIRDETVFATREFDKEMAREDGSEATRMCDLVDSQQRTIEMQAETINRQSKIIESLSNKES